jgi:type I restriction enzyme M protein
MTAGDKSRFLDAYPDLLEDVQAIDKALGREPLLDWNTVWSDIADLLSVRVSRWKAPQQKLFRNTFTRVDPKAEPVIKGGSGLAYEPNPDLRDFENVPLKDDVEAFFRREVSPYVPDAWMDRTKDKTGYEINLNQHFYRYVPPRPLAEIDADLKRAEETILHILKEVTR